MGASQVLGPLEDYMQATHRLVKLPKIDRFRFELRQVLQMTKQTLRPQQGKWATARRRRPDDSPLGKRSFSPPSHYTNVLYHHSQDHSGLLTTRNRQSKGNSDLVRMHRRKHQSIGEGQQAEDKSLHFPSVVNLTYDTRGEETRRRLRPRLLPLRGRKVQQTESFLGTRKAAFSPTIGQKQAVESTPTATPTCITPYLTPKLTRRVIFTKEATAIT